MQEVKPPTPEIQEKALSQVKKTFKDYQRLLSMHRTLWLELFYATYIFETKRKAEGQSTIFFPKCFEQVEKIAPRLTANNPKFVIGLNVPINMSQPDADMSAYAQTNQASLNYFWKIGNCQAKLRSWAKSGLVYNVSWAETDFVQKTMKTENVETEQQKNGEIIERTIQKEEVLMEYPTFNAVDIFEMYFDPRIEFVDDMRAVIRRQEKVSKKDLLAQKDKYFNLDKLKEISGTKKDDDGYTQNKFSAQGIGTGDKEDECLVTRTRYCGYFNETDDIEDEALYEIVVINDELVIGLNKIKFIPFEKFVPIEIPGQGIGKGVVEPVKKLQDAYNLTRNQRFENVSLVLNRMWLLKIGAGVDPRKLVSRAGNVISVKDPEGLIPVPTPDITSSAFEEANSINTEIQTTLGTIDTTQDSSDNGFTNLATGQKIRWNEYNVRFNSIKKNLEESLERLGQKMLMMVGEKASQNPLVQDEHTQKFFEVAKEAFDSISDFYNISVLADSTSIDSIENKRDDVLAFGQLAIAYKSQGVNIPMDKVWMDIVESFPGRNPVEYIAPPEAAPQQEGNAPNSMPQSVIDQARVQPSSEDLLNKQLTNV